MSVGRQIAFWLAAFVVIGLLLRVLGGAVAPFALGMVLGYLLDPIVQRLERLGLNRLGASLVILVAFVLVVAIIAVVFAPLLGGQLVAFTQKLPTYVVRLQSLAVEQGNAMLEKYGGAWREHLGVGAPL
jgi:predicted PurR-regulated permease PerM